MQVLGRHAVGCTCGSNQLKSSPVRQEHTSRLLSNIGSSQRRFITPLSSQKRTSRAQRHLAACVRADASWTPPTVSDTKAAFYENFKKPIPPIYNTVIQELLVQQHLMRWNKNYQFDEVFALGFVSVFDQILEGLPEPITQEVFKAYVDALQEDPQQFRSGAERVESWIKELSSSADLKPDANGSDIQKMLAGIANRAQEKKFSYNKFFAIGLFRMLELTGAKDPKALKALVESVHINLTTVNRDLTSYKGILSKLSAAKELMAELTQRERRKQAERDAEKAEKLKKDNEKSEEKLPADANACK